MDMMCRAKDEDPLSSVIRMRSASFKVEETHIPFVSMDLYAQAAARPDHMYPACLEFVWSDARRLYKRVVQTNGAMIALHPAMGGVKSCSSEDCTAASHPPNCSPNTCAVTDHS
jgi:hypothetical protein